MPVTSRATSCEALAFPCVTINAKNKTKKMQTRETFFQFHISSHLWYRDSGMHSCSDTRELFGSVAAQHMLLLGLGKQAGGKIGR